MCIVYPSQTTIVGVGSGYGKKGTKKIDKQQWLGRGYGRKEWKKIGKQ